MNLTNNHQSLGYWGVDTMEPSPIMPGGARFSLITLTISLGGQKVSIHQDRKKLGSENHQQCLSSITRSQGLASKEYPSILRKAWKQCHQFRLQAGCYKCQTLVHPPTKRSNVQTWTYSTRNKRPFDSARPPIREMPKIPILGVLKWKALRQKTGHWKRMGLATYDPRAS